MASIFSKTLSDTDVRYRLAIPTDKFTEFGQIPAGANSIDFEAVDNTGRPWRFCVSTRKTGKYSKPVLGTAGWLSFVHEKELRIGDIITFFRETNEANGVRFRIKAERKIMLFGQDIVGEV